MWIDTHCHLDAGEFDADRADVVARAAAVGVRQIVLPAVDVNNLATVRELAHRFGLAYALGIHPLCVDNAGDGALARLDAELQAHRDDPRLVAVGEIGIDFFIPGLSRERQEHFYAEQLALARRHELPVIVHVRRSADMLLKHLRRHAGNRGIVHAFNGSAQQAEMFVELGFKLGFGGAMTFDRALQIRRLAESLPADAIVMETDSPDIPPHWLYRTAAEREASGDPRQARNEPAQLPRIAEQLAQLRGVTPAELAESTTANAIAALPRLGALGLH
ncbi:TatD family hydrolase [Piscinibacter sakaiensis]|uniref:TatD family hydrolase n=1 Tax=Piscinibacter sakaiensis TaxID=1547922 RepID=UPI003AB07C75